MVQMQSWPGWQLLSTATRSLFFAERRRVISGADTAGSRLLANVFCFMGFRCMGTFHPYLPQVTDSLAGSYPTPNPLPR
jgi:hypothetical protein